MAERPFVAPAQRWWDSDTVAVVTGANQGIGYGIARILASQDLKTIVCARSEERGIKAVQDLKQETGSDNIVFEKLDVASPESVQRFAERLQRQHGGATILVNNAGFAFKGDVFGADEAQLTMDVNYYGVKRVTEAVAPLLQKNGRVVTVSSRSGLSRIIQEPGLKQRFLQASSVHEIDQLAAEFVSAIRDDRLQEAGWPRSMYGVSKLACTMYNRVMGAQLQAAGIPVNACCPGYVNTSMTSHKGVKTLAQGADTPCWLALMPPSEAFTSKLCAERSVIDY